MKIKATVRLTANAVPGDRVWWRTIAGRYHEGTLKEWDNGTAIVVMADGSEKAV